MEPINGAVLAGIARSGRGLNGVRRHGGEQAGAEAGEGKVDRRSVRFSDFSGRRRWDLRRHRGAVPRERPGVSGTARPAAAAIVDLVALRRCFSASDTLADHVPGG